MTLTSDLPSSIQPDGPTTRERPAAGFSRDALGASSLPFQLRPPSPARLRIAATMLTANSARREGSSFVPACASGRKGEKSSMSP